MKTLVYIISFFVLIVNLRSEEDLHDYQFDILINRYSFSGDFKNLGGEPDCCENHRSGKGTSPSFTLSKPISLFNSRFDIFGGISLISGDMTHEENTSILLNRKPYQGTFRHSIDFNIVFIDFGISKILSFSDFEFGFAAGLHFMPYSNYTQKEELISPENKGVFSDTETRIRNTYEGSIPDTNPLLPYLQATVSYQIIRPIENQFLSIKPIIAIEIPAVSIINSGKWRFFKISAGVAFSFNH